MKIAIRMVYLFTFSIAVSLHGNELEEKWPIQKTNKQLKFDGYCDEALWNEIDQFPLRMYRPNHGADPTEESEVFVTFDDRFLYVGARLHYKNDAVITVTTKKRDGADGGSDNFGILLDTFNDNENALCFETNPSGLRSDFTMANDGQSNVERRPFNRSWNTFWDVKTKIVENTWHLEIRIPLSSLRFQEQNGEVNMGMTIWRSIVSKQEWNVFPLVSNEFGGFGLWKPSQAKKIVFNKLNRKNPVYITPYLLTGLENQNELNNSQSLYQMKTDTKLNAGLDLKYALTSNITMDLTLNTDFAQVEADDQIVNLTRFSVFFPEKRQFFLERNSVFTLQTGFFDQLFYSRRIGLVEGEIIPIIGGVRLVGRIGKYDIGFMDMQTAEHDFIDDDDSLVQVASTNHGVLRLRKQVFNQTSYVGGMVTSQIDVHGNYNINTAVDLIYNPFRNDYLTANYTQTFDNDHPVRKDFYNFGKVYLNWQNRSEVGFSYTFQLSRAGEFYIPEMGFELLENYTRGFGSLSYGWVYNHQEKKMLSQQFSIFSWLNKRNYDLKTEISRTVLNYSLSMKSGYRGLFRLMYSYEQLFETFELSDDVFFPEGTYKYTSIEANIGTPSNKLISLMTDFQFGQYYDGKTVTFGPAVITFRPSASVKLGLDYQYSQVDIPDRNQYFKAHLARLRTEFTFTTKLSLLTYFQYSSDEKFGINNVRFRYNPREGNDLYLVYNGSYNTHLLREIPTLPMVEGNSLILKYTYTFIWEKK